MNSSEPFQTIALGWVFFISGCENHKSHDYFPYLNHIFHLHQAFGMALRNSFFESFKKL